MHATVKTWLNKTNIELDKIYSNAEAGKIPKGDTRGTAILSGSMFAKSVAFFARALGWQGKIFDLFCPQGNAGILINKITPFSLAFIVAKVYRDKSWFDGKETIVIDYSKTSFVAKAIRDEIREVEPGVYLGKVWWGKKEIFHFALTQKELS